jgi:hypothetical protein
MPTLRQRADLLALSAIIVVALACQATPTAFSTSMPPLPTDRPQPTVPSRDSTLPAVVKLMPDDDAWPPVIASGWNQPVPLGRPINTAGGEDSPFVTPDGETLYFVFTPDVRVPVDKQLFDGVTGIWVTQRAGEGWAEPERVHLAGAGDLHLDGCPFVQDDLMVFCSARVGNVREIDLYTAAFQDGIWSDWQIWGEPIVTYDVGEMHISADGSLLFFGSPRPGGHGGSDLWVSEKTGGEWGEPINLGPQINTDGDENRPFVTADGQELWFDSASLQGYPGPAVYRSVRQPDGSWGPREEVVSSFAGEPTLTGDGHTLYFVHHYYSPDLSQMLEADIYAATRLK